MPIPFFARINQQKLQNTRAPKARAKIFSIVVEFLKNNIGPAVQIRAVTWQKKSAPLRLDGVKAGRCMPPVSDGVCVCHGIFAF